MPNLAVYVLDNEGDHHRIAECGDDSLALCLRTLTDEGQITCASEVGIFDLEKRFWLINPFPATPFAQRRTA